ncbi:MAG: hypothetical protein U0990_09480 [Candidatus Nanopelagicales bacterium]|nr:hypothetical protein [Candidatus Nanopelagicales bacterium]
MPDAIVFDLLKNDPDIGVADRVWPEWAKTPAVKPYICYFIESVDPVLAHSGKAGLSRATVRLECYGATYTATKAIADAVRKKLNGFQGTVASIRVDAVIVTDGGRAGSIMPDDGGQTAEWMRAVLIAIWFADANN